MNDLKDVTIGLKTFYRTEKLRNTLRSLVGLNVKEVIVADDGPEDPEKEKLYQEMSEYLPLKVIRLPYNSGLAYGRNRIVENTKTPYLLIMDDDMEVLGEQSISILKNILESNKALGGVGALLFEKGRIRSGAHNLIYKRGYIVRDVPLDLQIEVADGIPYIRFDQILNAALFRVKCLRDYPWDDYYKINFEHLDFYWGHKQLGKWKFAVTPAVVFKHYPGGNKTYKKFRFSRERYRRSKEYFLKKWNIKGIINIQMDFLLQNLSLKSTLWLWTKKHAPFTLLPYMMKIEERWAR
ncbi:glycosyltransferase [Thermococcus sp. M36]|uniref:glycosyltransferase family 2 protein n=2 Tax=unclassified Thermococcus TaxID=2627626 RepID=UPI00143919AF|nr:glycosyltransferase [Thermococcus sp. M36]NJE05718.1 glycosyltransferase [Thermococcus sp. M36]